MACGLCAVVSSPAHAQDKQEKSVLNVTLPATTVRLLGARCLSDCWLSDLFAPALVRDKVAAVAVTNSSPKDKVKVVATFVPTNGLAMAQKESYLGLQQRTGVDLLTGREFELESGQTAQLKVELTSVKLPAGLYTGQLEFTFKPSASDAGPIVRVVGVEIRVRDSAVWALLTVILGIVVGRLGQLVYDPKVMARVQFLDWLQELEQRIAGLEAPDKAKFAARLGGLRMQLFSRGVDPDALKSQFDALESDLNALSPAPAMRAARPESVQDDRSRGLGRKVGRGIGRVGAFFGGALRILAGIKPLPLPAVHDWLLPIFVLLTLVGLTVVFMLQQYGGGGAAEVFGADGLADYAGLFLAGVASEAIAGGLRGIKLR